MKNAIELASLAALLARRDTRPSLNNIACDARDLKASEGPRLIPRAVLPSFSCHLAEPKPESHEQNHT